MIKDYAAEIAALKKLAKEQRAIILAHYYCRPELQDAADFVGDSLGLASTAAETDAEAIVFCGVHFMAETASILSPEKKVVLVNSMAGCPMADMITAEELAAKKEELPGVAVLTYVNSSAAVKALSDACCTSANVAEVLRNLPGDTVLMTPDKNLAAFAQSQVPEKKVLAWEGWCPIHHQLTAPTVKDLQSKYPNAQTLAHPECRPEVLALADMVGSTTGIIAHCQQSTHSEFLVLTEEGVGHQLAKIPGKTFRFPENMTCWDMKKNTLADLRKALETLSPEVRVTADIRAKALAPLQKMMAAR